MDHIRDTQLGHLVRFLTGNRLLQYPDEIDPSIWKSASRHGNVSVARRTQEGNSDSEKFTEIIPPFVASNGSHGVQDVDVDGLRAVEAGKDVCLVDWYGPGDPEVGLYL